MYVGDVRTFLLACILHVSAKTSLNPAWLQVTEFGAGLIVNQLLYLEASDPEKEISMYINSRGTSVYL